MSITKRDPEIVEPSRKVPASESFVQLFQSLFSQVNYFYKRKSQIQYTMRQTRLLWYLVQTDPYWYVTEGTDDGTYELEIILVKGVYAVTSDVVNFTIVDILTAPGAIHQHSINCATLS